MAIVAPSPRVADYLHRVLVPWIDADIGTEFLCFSESGRLDIERYHPCALGGGYGSIQANAALHQLTAIMLVRTLHS